MPIKNGIPSKSEYKNLIKSKQFKDIEKFSNDFLRQTKKFLADYNNRWVVDPLHQWSRQWEYVYTIEKVSELAKASKNKMKVVDLGSGITFVPFLLADKHKDLDLSCVDIDERLVSQFEKVTEYYKSSTKLKIADMRDLPFQKNHFDIAYSVSVLEHTDNYLEIVSSIAKILKPNGKLIMTFDISIDGNDDISMERVKLLLDALRLHFDNKDIPKNSEVQERISSKKIVTSGYIASIDKSLMPWKYPVINVIRPLLKRGRPGKLYKNLTFYNLELTRKR